MKVVGLVALCAFALTACVEVTVTPSRTERRLPDTTGVLMCTTVAAVYDIVDNGIISYGCGYRDVIAPSVRSYYESRGRTYTIMEMGAPGNESFWAVPGVIREYRRRYY